MIWCNKKKLKNFQLDYCLLKSLSETTSITCWQRSFPKTFRLQRNNIEQALNNQDKSKNKVYQFLSVSLININRMKANRKQQLISRSAYKQNKLNEIKIKMSQVQNWHHVIKTVQNANLDQQMMERQIRGLNKRAYRQELDREVEIKNHQHIVQNQIKRRQLQQAKYLAQVEQQAKVQSRQISKLKQRHYGEENQQLIKLQNNIKSQSKEMQRKNIKNFLQHPFVKLVDNQDNRMQNLRRKFIKQNEINQLQEQMRNQQRQANRYKEMQQKNQFIDYVEESHQKRSADREKFKNKYLRIKKPQLSEHLSENIKPDLSVEKMYVSYLNNQIKSNHQRKVKEKADVFDDKRIQQFYSSGQVEPDSSPAFLGRNPMPHDRRRQLYFINKHLNTHHQRSITSNSQLNSKTSFIPTMMSNPNDHTQSSSYLRLAHQLNPEQERINISKHIAGNGQPRMFNGHSQSTNIRAYNNEHNITQRQRQRSYQNSPQIYSTTKSHHKSVLDNSRRIKSQLVEGNYESQKQKLPNISNKLLPPVQRDNMSVDSTNKKQYFRYDVISGKQVAFYV